MEEEEEVEAQGDSDMEGWEDDGWGNFDPIPRQDPVSSKPPQQQISSGADFFDSVGSRNTSSKTKPKDLFEDFGYPSAPHSGKERTPPVLTSASLFGVDKPAAGGVVDSADGGGWGDWDKDFVDKPVASKVHVCCWSL